MSMQRIAVVAGAVALAVSFAAFARAEIQAAGQQAGAQASQALQANDATGPMTAPGANARIKSIDSFLSATGLAMGTARPRVGSINVSSSDKRRHPRWIKPAVSVLLPAPGGAGRIKADPCRSTMAAWIIKY